MLTAKFTEAVEYARAHHTNDLRKGTTIPYLAHLLSVSALVLEHGGDETAAVAALLHEVVEDGGGEPALEDIDERFGARVAVIVKGCSDTTAAVKEDWTSRKERYLEHLESAPAGVLLVSAADKLHNARSILSDLSEHGEKLWERFDRGPHPQLWYYGSLRDIFVRRMPGLVERARPDGARYQPQGGPLHPPCSATTSRDGGSWSPTAGRVRSWTGPAFPWSSIGRRPG